MAKDLAGCFPCVASASTCPNSFKGKTISISLSLSATIKEWPPTWHVENKSPSPPLLESLQLRLKSLSSLLTDVELFLAEKYVDSSLFSSEAVALGVLNIHGRLSVACCMDDMVSCTN